MEKKEVTRVCCKCGIKATGTKESVTWKGIVEYKEKYYCANCLRKYYPQCWHCSKRHYYTRLRKLSGGRKICRKCYKNETTICESCKEVSITNDGVFTRDDTFYCNSCRDNNTFLCDDCDEVFDTNMGATSHSVCDGDRYVCSNCKNEHYAYCDSCSMYWERDNVHYCERCEEYYCDDCGHNCGNVYRGVNTTHQHGNKKGKYLIIKRLAGVEIEAECGDRHDLSDMLDPMYGIAEDASLDAETGVEVLTPPASLDKGEEIITDACRVMQKCGYRINRTCGLHVHLDASDFRNKPTKLARVLRTVYAVEDLLFSILPESRWSNQYCLRLSNQYSFNTFKGRVNVDDFESKWYKTRSKIDISRYKEQKHDGKGTRYCGLNLHSTMYRGTVEFRYHSGTVEAPKILKWIYLLLKIVNYAVKRYKDKEIVSLFSQPTTQAKLKKFFKIFRIRKDIQTYMKERIKKNNPNFRYFNNGKGRKPSF